MRLFATILFIQFSVSAFAMGDAVNATNLALKNGSSKELAKLFNEVIEVNVDGDKTSYSKSQAEIVIKDFFKKYPPIAFKYIHEGTSKGGHKYAIGKYTFGNGSFRVYILFKQFKGNFLIDTLDFSKE